MKSEGQEEFEAANILRWCSWSRSLIRIECSAVWKGLKCSLSTPKNIFSDDESCPSRGLTLIERTSSKVAGCRHGANKVEIDVQQHSLQPRDCQDK